MRAIRANTDESRNLLECPRRSIAVCTAEERIVPVCSAEALVVRSGRPSIDDELLWTLNGRRLAWRAVRGEMGLLDEIHLDAKDSQRRRRTVKGDFDVQRGRDEEGWCKAR